LWLSNIHRKNLRHTINFYPECRIWDYVILVYIDFRNYIDYIDYINYSVLTFTCIRCQFTIRRCIYFCKIKKYIKWNSQSHWKINICVCNYINKYRYIHGCVYVTIFTGIGIYRDVFDCTENSSIENNKNKNMLLVQRKIKHYGNR